MVIISLNIEDSALQKIQIIFEKDISKVIKKLENVITKSPLSLSIGLYYSKENFLELAKEKADRLQSVEQ